VQGTVHVHEARSRSRARNTTPWLFLLTAFLWTTAHADPTEPTLGDSSYLAPITRVFDGPAPPPLPTVVYPRIGWPELAPYAGTVTIWLRGIGQGNADDFRVRLLDDDRVAGGPAFPLHPVSLTWDEGHGVWVLTASIPAAVPRDTYDLEVTGPAIGTVDAAHAVRVYGALEDGFRFAFLADHQLWDPSWRIDQPQRNGGAYPRFGESEDNRAITRDEFAEIQLLDPDFVLDGGDLVFGLDCPNEYADMGELWRDFRAATFLVPGNHDGYAQFHVHIDASRAPSALIKAASCADNLGLSGISDLTDLSWGQISSFLLCAYGDLTPILFNDPSLDGLDFYRRTFGPTTYSFDIGPLHFIGLNTYGGSPERRHAFSIYTDLFDVHLGAPAVDNYGGYLDDAALAWVDNDAARADAAGQTVVLFSHQDPRGELSSDRRYAEDHPFPTDPISLEGFEEWNYDGEWASDPSAPPRSETADANSGTRLLGIIAEHIRYVLTGHVHGDSQTSVATGAEVAPGVTVQHPVDFVRVTTAASSLHSDSDYWGYRLFSEDPDGTLDLDPFDAAHGLTSIPAGNLWVTAPTQRDGGTAVDVVNGLPQPVRVVVRMTLPLSPTGYDIQRQGFAVRVSDVIPWADGKTATYLIPLTVGATSGDFPADPGADHVETLVATPATGPVTQPLLLAEACANGSQSQPSSTGAGATASATTTTTVGTTLTLTTTAADPAQVEWQVTGPAALDLEARGETLPVSLSQPGRYRASATVVDGNGAMVTVFRDIEAVAAPTGPVAVTTRPPRACACDTGGPSSRAPWGPLGVGLALAILALAGFRGRRWRRARISPSRRE
jgi:hypothetical protein